MDGIKFQPNLIVNPNGKNWTTLIGWDKKIDSTIEMQNEDSHLLAFASPNTPATSTVHQKATPQKQKAKKYPM